MWRDQANVFVWNGTFQKAPFFNGPAVASTHFNKVVVDPSGSARMSITLLMFFNNLPLKDSFEARQFTNALI